MPGFNYFSVDIVPVAQATGTGTTTPAQAPAEAEGSSMTFVFIGIAVVLFIALLLVAVRSFRPAAGAGDAPRRQGPDDASRPTRDLLADRDEVDEQSEITDDDSLAAVKKKKRERVKKSYAEARKELQARKADAVTQEQQRKNQDGEDALDDAEAPEAPADAADVAPEGADEAAAPSDAEAAEDTAEDAGEEPAEAASAEGGADAAPAAVAETDPPPAAAGELGFLDEINAGWEDLDAGDLSMSLAGIEAAAAPAEAASAPAETDETPEGTAPAAEEAQTVESRESEAAVAAAEVVEEPAAEASEEPAADVAEEPATAAAEEPAADVAEEPAADVAAEPAAEVAEEPAADVAEEPAADVAEEPVTEGADAAPAETAVEPVAAEGTADLGPAPKALSAGLEKTRGGFVSRLGSLFNRKAEIDADLLDELEEVLYTSDMGPKSVEALLNRVRTELDAAEISDPATVWRFIREETERILSQRQRSLEVPADTRPFVVLVVGVNGVGKTTTIGKLAQRFTDAGHKTLMVAGDTFRAAATEQLEEWGERTGLAVHTGEDKEDPASVVFSGVQRAADEGFDVVLCDTAGRLTNKKNLMKELEKIGRVASKACDGAPHETLLVLDANTGMMAVHQARMFQEVVDISGIVLTKLDGTAKGGVILGISEELQVPVQYIGIGEGVYDLRPFDAKEFVDALFM
jgi:fused signal recognition particle receptor